MCPMIVPTDVDAIGYAPNCHLPPWAFGVSVLLPHSIPHDVVLTAEPAAWSRPTRCTADAQLGFELKAPIISKTRAHADLCGARKSLYGRRKIVAGGLGFEPRFSESESDVLPLNYPPPRRAVALDASAGHADRHVRGAKSRAERGRYRWFRVHGPPLETPLRDPSRPNAGDRSALAASGQRQLSGPPCAAGLPMGRADRRP
jgi:hypothetical protein